MLEARIRVQRCTGRLARAAALAALYAGGVALALGRAACAEPAVEPAAVIGLEFARPALEALIPDAVRPMITDHLGTLVRRHFIRPSVHGW